MSQPRAWDPSVSLSQLFSSFLENTDAHPVPVPAAAGAFYEWGPEGGGEGLCYTSHWVTRFIHSQPSSPGVLPQNCSFWTIWIGHPLPPVHLWIRSGLKPVCALNRVLAQLAGGKEQRAESRGGLASAGGLSHFSLPLPPKRRAGAFTLLRPGSLAASESGVGVGR